MFVFFDIWLDENDLLDTDKMPNIYNKIAVYWNNLKNFFLLYE